MLTICLISFLLQNHLKHFFFTFLYEGDVTATNIRVFFRIVWILFIFFFIITFLTYGINFPRDHYSFLINV